MKKKFTLKQKIEIIDKLVLSRKIAKILAMQYWSGSRDTHNIKNMTFRQYLNKSLMNWMPAANGIIYIIKNNDEYERRKVVKALKNVPKVEEFMKNARPSDVFEKAHKAYLKQLEKEEGFSYDR